MKQRSRIALLCLLVAALSGIVWVVSSRDAGEPVYAGKRLSEWLRAFDAANPDQPGTSARDARRAVRQAGTNGIPVLLGMLRATDPPLKLWLVALTQKQRFIKFRFTTASSRRTAAMTAFPYLGIHAEAAVPELIKAFNEAASPDSQAAIAQALGNIGPAAKVAIPSLQRGTTSTNLSLQNAINNALNTINGRQNQSAWEYANPMANLRSSDGGQRVNAAYSLSGLNDFFLVNSGARAKAAVPALLAMLKEGGSDDYWVKFALEQIDPDTAARVLTNDHPISDSSELANDSPESGNSCRLLAVGDWSEPVGDARHRRLRGRLLVYEPPHYTNRRGEWWGHAPVEMELQDMPQAMEFVPVVVHFENQAGLECELSDAQGKPQPRSPPIKGTAALESWFTVPFDGAVRFRVDLPASASRSKPDGLTIQMGRAGWRIPAGDTNAYFLSGTFSSPTNRSHPLDYHVWGGTLKLPPVRIAAPKP